MKIFICAQRFLAGLSTLVAVAVASCGFWQLFVKKLSIDLENTLFTTSNT
jgi:hypothetical protein